VCNRLQGQSRREKHQSDQDGFFQPKYAVSGELVRKEDGDVVPPLSQECKWDLCPVPQKMHTLVGR